MMMAGAELHAIWSVVAAVAFSAFSYGVGQAGQPRSQGGRGGISAAERKKLDARTKKETGLSGRGQGTITSGGPAGGTRTVGQAPIAKGKPRLLGRSGD